MVKEARNNTSELNCTLVGKFMRDEKSARVTYRKLGLEEMSNDERDHFRILQRAGNALGCKNLPELPKGL